jgi:hypothetical protein
VITRIRKRPRDKYLRRVPRYSLDLREHRRRINHRNIALLQSLEMSEAEASMPRTFTLAEAETLLPVLESLLRSAMQAKALIEEVEAEFDALRSRILANGGMLLKIEDLARRKAERDKAVQRAKDAVAEIDAAGVQVKDLDIGLLDFPCVVDGDVVLLCWKLGEQGITHYHGTNEGFAGRKPIDGRISRGQKSN